MYSSCYLTLTQKYSSVYLIRVISILLIIGGVEFNPGPPTKSKQLCRLYKLLRQRKLLKMISNLLSLGARLETRLQNIEQKFEERDQRLTPQKNDSRIKSLEDHGNMLDRKIRENNLIFYGIKGPEAENSDKLNAN
ncbi:hypothetical protein LAZ67_14002079 [Cordylochernes scorpioides]|uniref:Uncharacterized protein n=1 Tax=Cordylochernes scorpioides TaxID=51811 RepID=A0ABY6L7H4_9ARAC|nr:hypothetical protein LAZ67_14002079 [Cordylochernes scorpioides]